MDSWESKIADAFARHGDSVATCLIVDPVKRNRKANKAKREGVGGSSHEKMLERSRSAAISRSAGSARTTNTTAFGASCGARKRNWKMEKQIHL